VPTSVMAQLDASVGGKVAVNHKSAKNLVGAFWHPDGVIIDPHYLSTLPDAEIRNGLAEAVKVAIIDSPELFELLERLTGHSSGPDLSPEALTPIIRLAVEAKIRLLADDPFERDLRRALNLGHTFAHAFETQQNYTLRHGYAVAIGTAIATMVSVLRGRLDTNTANRIFNTLESLDLPTSADREIAEEIWNKTLLIKRIRGNNIHYVIPIEIGQVDIVDELTKDEFLVAYMAILERRRSMSMGVGISSGASR
jgi:3-dehydroquinate synthase